MNISIETFNSAIRAANEAGKRGREVSIIYLENNSATSDGNGFIVVNEYTLSASGRLDRVY